MTTSPKGTIDDNGVPDAIGPHGSNPPSRGLVDRTATGGSAPLNLDDDEIYSGRGKDKRAGGSDKALGADSGRLGPPKEQLSESNLPSDTDREGQPKR
jgi:hypothetical protein